MDLDRTIWRLKNEDDLLKRRGLFCETVVVWAVVGGLEPKAELAQLEKGTKGVGQVAIEHNKEREQLANTRQLKP